MSMCKEDREGRRERKKELRKGAWQLNLNAIVNNKGSRDASIDILGHGWFPYSLKMHLSQSPITSVKLCETDRGQETIKSSPARSQRGKIESSSTPSPP